MEKNKTRKVFKVNANIFTICMTAVVAVVVIGKVKENVTFSLHFSPGNSPVIVIIIIAIIRKRQMPIYLLPPTEEI